jgi:hypothetical protein
MILRHPHWNHPVLSRTVHYAVFRQLVDTVVVVAVCDGRYLHLGTNQFNSTIPDSISVMTQLS